MDLKSLDLAQLRALEQKVKVEIRHRQSQEMANARQQILNIAQSVGIPLKDLIGSSVKVQKKQVGARPGKKVPMRYRHPEHAELTWTGRGVKPRWVRAWLAAGGTVDQLRIAV